MARIGPRLAGTLLTALLATLQSASFPAPVEAQLRSEPARSAQSFIDSFGVNVHLSYSDGPYGRTADVLSAVRKLGMHHLRDGITLGRPDVCAADRRFAAAGLRFTYIAPVTVTPEVLDRWSSCVGDAAEAYEGANEYDISHPQSDPAWAQTLRNSQHVLYQSIRSMPPLHDLPVIAPSLTSPQAYRAVGSLSDVITWGNMHDYFAGHEPETGGWGLGGYGSLAYNMALARTTDGDKPIASTETGYGTDTRSPKNVDDRTQAAYVLRLFLEQFAAGVPRTFLYELVDEDDGTFGHYGLLTRDLTPKPSFTALASFVSALHAKPADANGTLRLQISGGDHVREVLLSRGPRQYDIVLWQDASTFDPVAMRSLTTPPETVTLSLERRPQRATLYAADEHFTYRPVAVDPGNLRVTLTAMPAILEVDLPE